MTPRQYQYDVVELARELLRKGDVKRIIIQAATGAGKTVIAAMMMASATKMGKRVLFLAPARELVNQCSNKLNDFDVPHGIIMAGRGYDLSHLVQVASKDTLWSRAKVSKRLDLPAAELVFVDEAHLSLSRTWKSLIESYPAAVIVGLTATPARGDGKGLGDIYQGMVQTIPPSKLIGKGFLVPTKVWAPSTPDLKGVKISKGDYQANELEKTMNKAKLVGDIVSHWQRLGDDRQTIVRTSGIEHSMHIRDSFLAAGVKAEHLDGETPLEEREAIIKRFASGDTRILTQCNIVNCGFDCPAASCLIDANPTKSYVRFRQGAGRIQRPCDGKTFAVYLDHAGNVIRHGMPDADIEWELTTTEQAAKKPKDKDAPLPKICPACKAVIPSAPVCPACGYQFKEKPRVAKAVENEDGVLVEFSGDVQAAKKFEDYKRSWHKALAVAANRGQTPRTAAGIFIGECKVKPWDVPGLPNVPQGKVDWNTPVRDLYPQYVRGKKPEPLFEVSPFDVCTASQANILREYGHEPTGMSIQEASRIIDGIKARGWK